MSGGDLVVIKRSGLDGMRYQLPSGCVTLGRDDDCDIRVLLPTVSPLHATVQVHRNRSVITNESSGETLVNGSSISVSALQHGDIITLGDRCLRWEYYTPAQVQLDNAHLPQLPAKGRRKTKQGKKKPPARASEPAARRLEPDVKALLQMRHRSSIAGGERQVAIVQPQRRGEDTSEPSEINPKVPTKPANKRASRAPKPGPSNEPRKSTRGNLTPKKDETPKKNDKVDIPKRNENDTPRKVTPKKDESSNNGTPTKQSPKKNTPVKVQKESHIVALQKNSPRKSVRNTPAGNAKNITRSNVTTDVSSAKKGSPRNTPKTSPKKGLDFSNVEPTDLAVVAARGTPKRATPKGPVVHVATPRPKLPYVELSTSEINTSAGNAKNISINNITKDVSSAKKGSPRNTPKTSPKKGLDFSKVEPTDLAVVAARGTPKRATPKGPIVHVATPRPKAPYVEPSPSEVKAKLVSLRTRTPMVNPLLRAATTRTPVVITPKKPTTKKRTAVEKIEDPSIDATKKSALMALTGRSPKNSLTPKLNPKYVIPKSSIKKLSPGSSRKGRNRVTGTPKLRAGSPRLELKRYTDIGGAGDGPAKSKSMANEIDLTTPAKRKTSQSSPTSRSTRRSQTATPTIIQNSEVTPRKSVLKSPTSSSPRKNESIKFDLSNLQKRLSDSPPPAKSPRLSPRSPDTTPTQALKSPKQTPKSTKRTPKSPKRTPKSPKHTPKSPKKISDTTSEEDLMLRLSSGSSTTDSPTPRRPIHSRSSKSENSFSSISDSTRSPTKSQSPNTPRKSSRGSFLVQKVLQTPLLGSPTLSDQSRWSSYSRRSTLTKSAYDTKQTLDDSRNSTKTAISPSPDKSSRSSYSRISTMTKTQFDATRTLSPNSSKNMTQTISPKPSRQKGMESYSIVDLVSIDSSRSVDETDTTTDYDSASSINSSYRTPIVKSTNLTPVSRGRSLVNLSLETSTPMVNRSRLSTRNTLLKSVTIVSAIKRCRSTPVVTKKGSLAKSPSKTPKRRSKSLTLSPRKSPKTVDETIDKRQSRSRSEITIEDSVIDTTVTPNLRASRNAAKSSRSSKPQSPNMSRTQSPNKLSLSRSNSSTPTRSKKFGPLKSPSPAKSANSPLKSPSPTLSRSSGRSSRSGQTPTQIIKSPTVKNSPRLSTGKNSPKPSTSKTTSPKSASKLASPRKNTPKSTGLVVSPSKTSPRSTRNVTSPRKASPKSSKNSTVTPESKRKSTSDSSISKRRSRAGKEFPRIQTSLPSDEAGPRTPENETSPDEAATPVLNIQDFLNRSQEKIQSKRSSVKETVKRFEAIATPKTVEKPSKVTRKTLGGIGERILARRSDLEAQNTRKAFSESRRKGKGITKPQRGRKTNLGALKKVLAKASERNSDENSVSSDETDENAPKPDNEIVITPKSSVQLVPEAVKGKHSTAKKSISRKSIIDHLNESQEIVKQLFNSPVKRKLSQSMSHYTSSMNVTGTSSRSQRSTVAKTPNVSFDFDSVKTPRVPTEMFVSPMDTPAPPSPNLVGVKRLYRKSPNNDLTNVRGVRALLKTPGTKKSPRNDLTNVSGVKELLGSSRKRKSPKDDLTQVSGVKQLLASSRKQKSPKNDLTQVAGVKQLFASVSKKQKSPRNDLRNVAGVKKLLSTPKGKQKSPKNDLTDVRGVKSVFRSNRSTRNALEDFSGIEELFSNSLSTIRGSENTMTEFDKFVGRTPVKVYGRAKSLAAKNTTPMKARTVKSVDAEISQNNVEEWLNKEIAKRTESRPGTSRKPNKKLSTSLKTKTPNKSIKSVLPKSTRIERALKKLTIDAVGGDIAITPDRRSRRVITAEKSSYSIEVAKALTPPKKKSQTLAERNSLPFKKRGHSNDKTATASKRKKASEPNLDNSAEALGLDVNKERISLPIKKRLVKTHEAIGHSTPVKKKARSKIEDADSVELAVSPIPSSPNATPRKNASLREARKTVEQASASIKSTQKQTKKVSIQQLSPKSAKKTPARGRKAIPQETIKSPKARNDQTKSPSPAKPAPKTRGRRGAKNSTIVSVEANNSPKKSTRGRRSAKETSVSKSPKLVITKKQPKKSPQKPTVQPSKSPKKPAPKPTRGRKAQNTPESLVKTVSQSPKPAPKGRQTRRGKIDTVIQETSSPTLVVAKKAPKLSPQKPKATRAARSETKTEVIPSPKNTRGRKAESPKMPTPKKARGRAVQSTQTNPSSKKIRGRKAESPKTSPSPKKTRGRKTESSKASPTPKTTRGKKSPQYATEPSSSVPSRRKRGSDNVIPDSPKPKVIRGRGRKTETKAESPKGRGAKAALQAQKKTVSFAVETEAKSPPRRAGGRRKAEPIVEEASKPQAKRSRGKAAAPAPSPVKPAKNTRGKKVPAKAPSPKTTRGRSTRQRK